MPAKKSAKRGQPRPRAAQPAQEQSVQPQNAPAAAGQPVPQQVPSSGSAQAASSRPIETLKQNLSGKRKAIFQILDDVKKVRPEQWQDPNQVEQLARDFANKLGLPVPEQRLKAFVNAYKDATKNGPTANVDELIQKYGQHVDEKTAQEIKKFVPKHVR
ncbi:hypothetical protein GCM10010885_10120 [Alicyclobacillus cellulosilyticus]|uniref:Uncharacterized protein n=1 Tax=Alicyclobacillus cellulosilyticus TaxID=1003997 RepID=A0A917NIE0_9BACL|nr:hypothetical protein [Alicyclobacillus cellulosilyticus]GGJ02774.1 hypothetical protein GCM10010885_10120 [Alicyclobacillus cellulosilyticus]